MTFDGPDRHDYDNVVSLNHAWLRLQRNEPLSRRIMNPGAGDLNRRMADLSRRQRRRLAATPFLLFSFRERDDIYWSRLLENADSPDLFRPAFSRDVDTLVAAALGFVWQLARQNPYVLRLICGASLYWCERIADQTFFQLLTAVRNGGVPPLPRLGQNLAVWQILLEAGTRREEDIRTAAQLAALQALLTEPQPPVRSQSMPLAARTVNAPGLRVAEENDPHSNS